MKTWILLLVLGVVLFIALRYREGVNDTLGPAPRCAASGVTVIDGWCKRPDVPSIPPVCPAGSTFSVGKCRGSDSMTAAQAAAVGLIYDSFVNQYVKPAAPTCPSGYTKSLWGDTCEDADMSRPVCSAGYRYDAPRGKCVSLTTDPSESIDGPVIDTCNAYWDDVIVSWAAGQRAASNPSCMKYAPSWITADMMSGEPSAATKAQAIIEKDQAERNKSRFDASRTYASSSGYADMLADIETTNNGALPAPMDARSSSGDASAARSEDGPVFNTAGLFSGQPGTGQGTASSAAAGLTGGSQYSGTAGGSYDSNGNIPGSGAYGMWQGTKGTSSPPAGNNLPVNGPAWGGRGTRSSLSSSAASAQSPPTLYGPQSGSNGPGSGLQSGYPQTNSKDGRFGAMCTTGSDPANAFAATSRCPGDKDMIPNPYLQSMSYSLANGSQKTDPVPFLPDFSGFQS